MRPGSHPGSSLGAGQEFVSHVSLYDRPDPRRLDLRASLRDLSGDWLVRVNRQRAGIPVHVVADVSASMRFGALKPKLHVVAEFVEALGQSAFRVGDALGMLAFDARERTDLFVPAHLSRGTGSVMASSCESARARLAASRDWKRRCCVWRDARAWCFWCPTSTGRWIDWGACWICSRTRTSSR